MGLRLLTSTSPLSLLILCHRTFPSYFLSWPDEYVWIGTYEATDKAGSTTCRTAIEDSTSWIVSNPQPTNPAVLSRIDGYWSRRPISDPAGLEYSFMQSVLHTFREFSDMLSDQPAISSCVYNVPGPNWGGFTQTFWESVHSTVSTSGLVPSPTALPAQALTQAQGGNVLATFAAAPGSGSGGNPGAGPGGSGGGASGGSRGSNAGSGVGSGSGSGSNGGAGGNPGNEAGSFGSAASGSSGTGNDGQRSANSGEGGNAGGQQPPARGSATGPPVEKQGHQGTPGTSNFSYRSYIKSLIHWNRFYGCEGHWKGGTKFESSRPGHNWGRWPRTISN